MKEFEVAYIYAEDKEEYLAGNNQTIVYKVLEKVDTKKQAEAQAKRKLDENCYFIVSVEDCAKYANRK